VTTTFSIKINTKSNCTDEKNENVDDMLREAPRGTSLITRAVKTQIGHY